MQLEVQITSEIMCPYKLCPLSKNLIIGWLPACWWFKQVSVTKSKQTAQLVAVGEEGAGQKRVIANVSWQCKPEDLLMNWRRLKNNQYTFYGILDATSITTEAQQNYLSKTKLKETLYNKRYITSDHVSVQICANNCALYW